MDGFPNFDAARAAIGRQNSSHRDDKDSERHDLPRLLSPREFMAGFQIPEYIVDGILQRGRLYALTSPTGHGKTAVALYLGCMIAAGRNIGVIEVAQGPVVFLSGENPDDLRCRFHAACQAYGLDPDTLPIRFMAGNFPLTPEAAETLKGQIDVAGDCPALIIVDTVAAYFPGNDDNSNVQMGAYARSLRVLTSCQGHPAVLALAHPVKVPDKENLLPRGGGAFLNELDGNLTLWAQAMGESATLHWQGKIRGADFAPVSFALQQVRVATLVDGRGRNIVSIVATAQSDEQAEDAAHRVQSDENTVLEWLRRHPGISVKDIALNARWVGATGVPNKAKVHRLLKALQREKLVTLHRGKWKLTSNGKKELNSE
jgi:RecA-family ATPase